MKLLSSAVGPLLSEDFVAGKTALQPSDLVSESGRPIELTPVRAVLDAAAARKEGPAQTDAWLAPRLHAALRLTRREAASRAFWTHLSVVDFPDYVRARFPGKVQRFLGDDVNNALSRLWWGAELFRVGPNYEPVARAFSPQDIPNTVFRLRAAHNRAFCAAFLDFVTTRRTDGRALVGRQVNRMSTAINSQLFVTALDAVAPDFGDLTEAHQEWMDAPIDIEAILSETPVGPDDRPGTGFAEQVDAVRALLDRVADGAGIATAPEPRAGSRRPGDLVDETGPSDDV